MPGEDFVIFGVSRDFRSYRPRVACYADAVGAMRMLLMSFGMDAALALTFTMHSWRHLFPTAARQLRLSESEQIEIGHWATGSSMPRSYDSAACVTELIAKSAITDALASGWQLAAPGCVPQAPPARSVAPTVDVVEALTVPSPCAKRAKPSIRQVNVTVAQNLRQVSHIESGKVHLWYSGVSAACNNWKCGSPDMPLHSAVFAKNANSIANKPESPFCKNCYSNRLSFLQLHAPDADDDGVSDDGGESSGYESGASDCEPASPARISSPPLSLVVQEDCFGVS